MYMSRREDRSCLALLILAMASAVGAAACASDGVTPRDEVSAGEGALSKPASPASLGREGEGTFTAIGRLLDANGDIDWAAVAATCDTLFDVASLSDTDLYLACGKQGLLHVTPNGVEAWTAPAGRGILAVKAASPLDIRTLDCYTVYRRGLLGGWVKDGEIKDIYSSGCGTALGTGHGAWFAGGRRIGGNGDLWRVEGGKWTSAGQKYQYGFEGGWFKFAVLDQDEVLGQVSAAFTSFIDAKFDRAQRGWRHVEESHAIALWEIPNTTTVYVSDLDGVHRRTRDGVRTLEWLPTDPDGGHPWVSEIWGRSSKEVYAVGRHGLFGSSKGDGVWTRTSLTTTRDLAFIWPWNGKIIVSDEYGDEFHTVP